MLWGSILVGLHMVDCCDCVGVVWLDYMFRFCASLFVYLVVLCFCCRFVGIFLYREDVLY